MGPFKKVPFAPPSRETVERLKRSAVDRGINFDRDVAPRLFRHPGELFINATYQVIREQVGALVHLSIKSLDPSRDHSWRDYQWIKNALVGAEHEGVQLYPAESRLVDMADQYHLWVAADPRYRFPFGFATGRATSEEHSAGRE
jgi:hypothetical protein